MLQLAHDRNHCHNLCVLYTPTFINNESMKMFLRKFVRMVKPIFYLQVCVSVLQINWKLIIS